MSLSLPPGHRSTMSILVLAVTCLLVNFHHLASGDEYHPRFSRPERKPFAISEESTRDFWNSQAINTIKNRLAIKPNENTAKNVILFMGDGMSVPTITAARIYTGDEKNELSFDRFPYTAVSKTYSVDYQVPDSACTATAYLTGIKANYGTIGVTAEVERGNCATMANASNHAYSVAHYAQLKNKSTGFVTTARVTHASPAGIYAHTSERDWESDSDLIGDKVDPNTCDDVAKQLIKTEVGKNLNVMFGGGRRAFVPTGELDDEGKEGLRYDDVNLINYWLQDKKIDNKKAEYVWNRDQLLGVGEQTDFVLGLFSHGHMPYNQDRDPDTTPSLAEMTEAAIKILSKNNNGYFLFVEGAKIDMAHHDSRANRALNETIEFSKAVEAAVNLTSENDTLIVVTADHAHTMSFSGYSDRGSNILDLANGGKDADDERPYAILNYANGPGAPVGEKRKNPAKKDHTDPKLKYQAQIPLSSETHGGDDVLVFAKGPWAHLYSGVLEQNVIPHIIKYASCVGEFSACDQ